jgi:hypothetical protein
MLKIPKIFFQRKKIGEGKYGIFWNIKKHFISMK